MRVVVGYDGTDTSKAAIAELGRAGLPATAGVWLVAALDIWPRLESNASSDAELLDRVSLAARSDFRRVMLEVADTKTIVEEAARRLRALQPNWRVFEIVRTGHASAVLLEAAADASADLIVLGSRRHGPLGRWVFGSLLSRVLAEARCTVRIARCEPGKLAAPPKNVVYVGAGLPQACARLAAVMASRSWPPGTELRVLAIRGSEPAAPDAPDANALWQLFKLNGTSTSASIESSRAAQVVLERIREWDADCLFLLRSNARPRWLAPEPLHQLAAEHACCSVEVVNETAAVKSTVVAPGG